MKLNHFELLEQIAALWVEYAPDVRFMIFINNFEYWLKNSEGLDLRVLPDNLLIKYMRKYCLSYYREGCYVNEEIYKG